MCSLIVFEGVDNVGKSYLARGVYDFVKNHISVDVVYLEYSNLCYSFNPVLRDMLKPGNGFLAEEIRLTWFNSHSFINDLILNYINNGFIVITDRYYYSQFVYRNMSFDDFIIENKDFIVPDVLFHIKGDPNKILYKNNVNNDGSVYENENKVSIIGRMKKYQFLFKNLSIKNNYDIFNNYDDITVDFVINIIKNSDIF
jgi:thymidylate kinase